MIAMRLVAATAVLMPSVSLTSQSVVVLAPGASLQAAIDAASDGDILLVDIGTSDSQVTIDNKSLTIAGLALSPIAQLQVGWGMLVRNLAPAKSVTLRNLGVVNTQNGAGLTVTSCLGPLHGEDCYFTAGYQYGGDTSVVIGATTSATFVRCSMRGAQAGFLPGAGAGCSFANASVRLHDCTIDGGGALVGRGGGGHGIAFTTTGPGHRLEAAQCVIRSGDGCNPGAPLSLNGVAGTEVVLTDNTLQVGAPHAGCTAPAAVVGNLVPIVRQVGDRALTVPVRATWGSSTTLACRAGAGQAVLAAFATEPRGLLFRLCDSFAQVDPLQATVLSLGVTDGAGLLTWSATIPPLPIPGVRLYLQGVVFDASGCRLTAPHTVLVLGPQF